MDPFTSGQTGYEYGNRFLGLRNRKKSGILNACPDGKNFCLVYMCHVLDRIYVFSRYFEADKLHLQQKYKVKR